MNDQSKAYLLHQLRSGMASDDEIARIEQLVCEGVIVMEEIEGFPAIQDHLDALTYPDAPKSLDKRFYAMLSAEKAKRKGRFWREIVSWPTQTPRYAFAVLMLVVGLAAGYFLRPGSSAPDRQIELLSHQVSELQEMMMLSLLEKGSATERLKAVTLTRDMDEVSKKVTTALLETLNQDENINVRLAALEALKPYAGDSAVREALIRSISRQDSPLVQVSLAELMVALQERASVGEFEKLIESEQTPPEIKKKIRESIDILI